VTTSCSSSSPRASLSTLSLQPALPCSSLVLSCSILSFPVGFYLAEHMACNITISIPFSQALTSADPIFRQYGCVLSVSAK
jgi:hypothetical protein